MIVKYFAKKFIKLIYLNFAQNINHSTIYITNEVEKKKIKIFAFLNKKQFLWRK